MRTFSKKKKLPRLLTLCGAVAVSALLGGCGQSGVPAESFDRSDYYTRGIGSYPGDPGEDFSPSLRPDYSTYRNIALLRSAYNSSSVSIHAPTRGATVCKVTYYKSIN